MRLDDRFYLPPGTAERWRRLVKRVEREHGVTLHQTRPTNSWDGWNGYRPLAAQTIYRKYLGIQAAVPGQSSHGGTWGGPATSWRVVPAAAVDVYNWAAIGEAAFFAAARAEGFLVDAVTPREPWHLIDLNPWTVPASPAPAAITTDPPRRRLMHLVRNTLDGGVYIVGPRRIKHVGKGTGPDPFADLKAAERAFGKVQNLDDHAFRILLIGVNVPYSEARKGADYQG